MEFIIHINVTSLLIFIFSITLSLLVKRWLVIFVLLMFFLYFSEPLKWSQKGALEKHSEFLEKGQE